VSAIAQGVGRDLVRPDAVTPVVSVATAVASTTATVTLNIVDPQGRVSEVEFRDRQNADPFPSFTVVSPPSPYTYNATIPTTGFVDVEYEVNGYTAAGVAGLIASGILTFFAGPVNAKITAFTTAFDYDPENYIEYNYTLAGVPGVIGTDFNINTFALLNGVSVGILPTVSTPTATQTVVLSPVTIETSGSITDNWEFWFEVTDNNVQVLATSATLTDTSFQP
jgi:hypothetical protein